MCRCGVRGKVSGHVWDREGIGLAPEEGWELPGWAQGCVYVCRNHSAPFPLALSQSSAHPRGTGGATGGTWAEVHWRWVWRQ